MAYKTYTARAPATLLGGASGVSSWIPVKGARMCIVHWKSTDATDVLTSNNVDISIGAGSIFFGIGTNGTTINHVTGGTGFRLDQGGLTSTITPPPGNRHMLIPWNYIRLIFTAAGATPANDISGFEITVDVFYDDENLDLAGIASTGVI